jgi:hypothetical protein
MSQKDLVFSLREEGLTAKQIYDRLVEAVDLLASAYLTVTKTIRKN